MGDQLRVVTATSFHPGEFTGAHLNDDQNSNAVLQAAAARNALLKTETSTTVEVFVEYDFRNNRGKKKKRGKKKNGSDDDEEDANGEDEEERESERPPLDVNEK